MGLAIPCAATVVPGPGLPVVGGRLLTRRHSEWTGAAITTRAQYFPPGRIPGPGERKLYLFIEEPSEMSVKKAKTELKRVLEDITNQALSLPGEA
ncbi:hypothetical protein GH714_007523 [Hevea brasiliensis]|uniref:ATP-dependent RNA helicase PRP5/DDX46/KHDC4 KH domain-containing protein n=1 Tax=Hevea brasiliensis TaxID=3981 RepID=A0A6A6M940_HEVBR|nr:hypothetical protein GH714_007523 [Hevea brasiliensis]